MPIQATRVERSSSRARVSTSRPSPHPRPDGASTACVLLARFTIVVVAMLALSGAALADNGALDYVQAMQQLVLPTPDGIARLQSALDHGWPSGGDARALTSLLSRNNEGLDALSRGARADHCAFDAATLKGSPLVLSHLRLLAALVLVRAEARLAARAASSPQVSPGDVSSTGDASGGTTPSTGVGTGKQTQALADLETAVGFGLHLLDASSSSLRLIGTGCLARAIALAGRLNGAPALALGDFLSRHALPSLSTLAREEREMFVEEAIEAGSSDVKLAPHVNRAASALAAEFYDPYVVDRPFDRVALDNAFTVLYKRLSNQYSSLDPRKVTALLPIPPPPARRLGQDIAGVALCDCYVNDRVLFRRYAGVLRAVEAFRSTLLPQVR